MTASKYDRLARTYDTRWSRYLTGSLSFARSHLFANPGETVLDVGCGTGQMIQGLVHQEPQVRAIGIDNSAAMLAEARARLSASVPLIRAQADALPMSAASCDWVMSTSMFHDLEDPERAVREWRRVLKPGGRLVVLDWCADDLVTRAIAWWAGVTEGVPMHVFSAGDLSDMLRAHDLIEVEIRRRRVAGWGLMVATARRPPASRC